MPRWIRRLWSGEVPLYQAFWLYAVVYGILANLFATIAAMAIAAAKGPDLLVVAVFALPVPYNAFICAAVWRSAARYAGSPRWALLARVVSLIWAVMLSLA